MSCSLQTFSWKIQGKPLEALLQVWHEIPCEPELVFLQEVGGTFEESQKEYCIDEFHPKDGYEYTAFACHPNSCFRKFCMLVRTDLVPHIVHVHVLHSGIFVQFSMSGGMLFAASLHLPHSQRGDVDSVWEQTILELHGHMRRIRHQDHVCIGIDANLELCMPFDESFRSVHARAASRTWWNHACESRIEYILHGGPRLEFISQHVHEWIGRLLPCDHALVCATVQTTKTIKLPRRRQFTRCGKWQVNLQTALEACEKLHEYVERRIQEGAFGLCLHELIDLAQAISFRPRRFRFVDPPAIKAKIAERRTLQGEPAHSLAAEIVALRRAAKKQCLADVLHRAKCGDFAAISSMKRGKSMSHTHASYVLRAGGEFKALADLKAFYSAKYACPRHNGEDSELALAMVSAHCSNTNSENISIQELQDVLASFKKGKSAAEDGVCYEFLQVLAQTSLRKAFVDFLNSILRGIHEIPPAWFEGRLTF